MAEATNKYLLLELELAKTCGMIEGITADGRQSEALKASKESRILLEALEGYKANIEWQMKQEIR